MNQQLKPQLDELRQRLSFLPEVEREVELAEVQAHLEERQRSLIELGESPQAAHEATLKKWGDDRSYVRALRLRWLWNRPLLVALLGFVSYIIIFYSFFLICVGVSFAFTNLIPWTAELPYVHTGVVLGILLPGFLTGLFLGRRFPNRQIAVIVGAVLAWLIGADDAWSWLMAIPHFLCILLGTRFGTRRRAPWKRRRL